MKATVLAVICLTIGALLSFLLLPTIWRKTEPSIAHSSVRTGTATIVDDNDIEPSLPNLANGRETVAPSANSETQPLDAHHITQQGSAGCRLLVINGRTGTPLADAEVWVLDFEDLRQRYPVESNVLGHNLPAQLERLGAKSQTDNDGYAKLPAGRDRLVVSAAHADLYGIRDVLLVAEEAVVLELHKSPSLEVLVTDGSEEPVGGITVLLKNGARTFSAETTRKSDGIARFDRITWISNYWRPEQLGVTLDLPWDSPILEHVDIQEIPDEPIQLTLPPCGRIEVVVIGSPEDGSPSSPVAVAIRALPSNHDDVSILPSGHAAVVRWTDPDGYVAFEHVGLGLLYGIDASSSSGGYLAHQTLEGPRTAGSSAHVKMRIEEGAPLIVSGIVQGTNGEPVAGALARAKFHGISLARLGTWPHPRVKWNTLTDEEGAFSIHGYAPEESFLLYVSHSGYQDSPVQRIEVGHAQTLVVLEKTVTISGRLLLGAHCPAHAFVVEARPSGAAPDAETLGETVYGADGSFTIQQLLPGTYDISIKLPKLNEIVRTIHGVTASSAESAPDPRLLTIDLREDVKCFTIVIDTPQGIPKSPILASLSSAITTEQHVLSASRELEVATLHESVDITVHMQGCHPLVRHNVDAPQSVLLELGLPVRLMVADLSLLPDPPMGLDAQLIPISGPPSTQSYRSSERNSFDGYGESLVHVPEAGTYLLTVELTPSGTPLDVGSKTIDVDDVPGEQVREILLPREAVKRAIARAGGGK